MWLFGISTRSLVIWICSHKPRTLCKFLPLFPGPASAHDALRHGFLRWALSFILYTTAELRWAANYNTCVELQSEWHIYYCFILHSLSHSFGDVSFVWRTENLPLSLSSPLDSSSLHVLYLLLFPHCPFNSPSWNTEFTYSALPRLPFFCFSLCSNDTAVVGDVRCVLVVSYSRVISRFLSPGLKYFRLFGCELMRQIADLTAIPKRRWCMTFSGCLKRCYSLIHPTLTCERANVYWLHGCTKTVYYNKLLKGVNLSLWLVSVQMERCTRWEEWEPTQRHRLWWGSMRRRRTNGSPWLPCPRRGTEPRPS